MEALMAILKFGFLIVVTVAAIALVLWCFFGRW